MRTHALGVALGSLAWFAQAAARADQPFVDPADVRSATGEWVLHIEPSEVDGSGPAKYQMMHNGVERYHGKLEYTLRECVVSKEGVVVGYAYDNGYMGWDGNIVILVIGADGGVLNTDLHRREGPAMAIDPPPPADPRGSGVLLDDDGGRAIVRVSTRDLDKKPARWWIYSLKDGSNLGEQAPATPNRGDMGFSREIGAWMVPSTDLIAIHWVAYERGVQSASVDLLDRKGNAVWSRRIDAEYAGRPRGWNWWKLIEDHVQQVGVGSSEFSIVSYSEGERTKYGLAKGDAGEWVVTEMGKERGEPAGTASVPEQLKTRPGELRQTAEITLGAPQQTGVIDEVHSLCFDGRGRMGWVRWVRSEPPAQRFTLIDQEGRTISDHELTLPPDEHAPLATCAWLDGDRWIVARTIYKDEKAQAQAWFLDVPSGKMTAIEGFSAGRIKRICRVPLGERAGFVVLGTVDAPYTMMDQVTRYDADGKLVSSKTEEGYGRGDLIMDIAVLSDGTLALLTGVANYSVIKFVRPDGTQGPAWNVDSTLGDAKDDGQPYYADIRADVDGGLVIYDSAHQNHLHRINKDGKVTGSFHVRGPEDEAFRLYDSFAVEPGGRLWASDGTRLYRCGPSGQVDLALGGPTEGSMAQPVAVTMDSEGSIYAVEKGTAAVHIFDKTGKPVRVMRPDPKDTPTQDALAWIVVDADGRVRYRMTWEGPIVTFDKEGKRVGVETPEPSWRRAKDSFEPVRGGGWEQVEGAIRRLVPDGAAGKTIRHRPDGAWLVSIVDAQAAADGSIAVLCKRSTPGRWLDMGGPMWVCLYGPNGEGRGTAAFEPTSMFPRLGYDGTGVLLLDEKGVTLFDRPLVAGGKRFELPGKGNYWHVLPRPDGTLATWAAGTRKIQLWARPE